MGDPLNTLKERNLGHERKKQYPGKKLTIQREDPKVQKKWGE